MEGTCCDKLYEVDYKRNHHQYYANCTCITHIIFLNTTTVQVSYDRKTDILRRVLPPQIMKLSRNMDRPANTEIVTTYTVVGFRRGSVM